VNGNAAAGDADVHGNTDDDAPATEAGARTWSARDFYDGAERGMEVCEVEEGEMPPDSDSGEEEVLAESGWQEPRG
jgi:hypothetical protein